MRKLYAAHAFVISFLALSGCASPTVVSQCSVSTDPGDQLIATFTLTNRSLKPIIKTEVLIAMQHLHPARDNRLFEVGARVAPGETRVLHARAVDSAHYDFKDDTDARSGCEVEQTVFADGTTWEMPSPL